MPAISMFYGIVITMYNNGSEHNPPHFHARYREYRAVFTLEGDLENGEFLSKQKHLITAWHCCMKTSFWQTGIFALNSSSCIPSSL